MLAYVRHFRTEIKDIKEIYGQHRTITETEQEVTALGAKFERSAKC
jgi:hypothetical protein